MQERATLFGGVLSAAPREGGGFRVHASLPSDRARSPGRAMTIRVVLADDETLVRAGLRLLLEGEPDLEVVGEAADGHAAVDTVLATGADVVLMDVRMPVTAGVAAAHALAEAGAPTRVLVLTTFDEEATVEAALRAGVRGLPAQDRPAGADARRRAPCRRRPGEPRSQRGRRVSWASFGRTRPPRAAAPSWRA